jgi:phage terminase large subunit-like protein
MDGAEPNLMYAMRERSRSDTPPKAVRYIEYSADPGSDPGKPSTWKQANPAVGRLVDPKAIANDYATMPLSRFGQMRLGLWTQHESAWISIEEWDALPSEAGPPPAGATITLGFDGSVGGDTTALVAYEPASARLCVLGYWERPKDARGSWRVPRRDVRLAIETAFERYNVIACYYDPFYWRETFSELADAFGEDRIVEYATNQAGRMAPATDAFRTAVVTGQMIWDGDANLRAHVISAIAKQTPVGDVIVKDARKPQWIDLAIAAILAREAARTAEDVGPAIW